jgi:cell division septation protein DedD
LKPVKSPVKKDERKSHSDTQGSAQSQALSIPLQPEIPSSTSALKPVAQELTTNSLQPDNVKAATVEQASTPSQPKTGGDATKAPQLYFEVGTFKDETWANNAVDKLTQLGFHAMLIHKNLLWSQSYHVQVGPYTNQKDIAEARQSLASQGFKAHPVN